MPNAEFGLTQVKLALITEHAVRDSQFRFTSLHCLLNKDFLRGCFHGLDKNKAVGIDGVTWEDYSKDLEENLDRLIRKIGRRSYKPLPSKRVYIPKLTELKVQLNEDKTKIRHVSEGFDFLGFTYKEAYSSSKRRNVRIKFPRAKSMKKIRLRIKEAIKHTPLGMDLREVIPKVNAILRGWANYFKIGQSYRHGIEISNYACRQLRIYWRRHKGRKRTQCSRTWPNAYFHTKGLIYVPNLLKG